MEFLNLKIGIYLFLTVLIGGGLWYFLQNESKYLEKKTGRFISLTSLSGPVSQIQATRRINEMEKLLRFDIHMELKIQKEIYTAGNLQQTKSFFLTYFMEAQSAQWKKENLNVKMNEKENTALVSFSIKGNYNERQLHCKVYFQWLKEYRWLIQSIQVFQCLPLQSPLKNLEF